MDSSSVLFAFVLIYSTVYFGDAADIKNASAGEAIEHIICTGCLSF